MPSFDIFNAVFKITSELIINWLWWVIPLIAGMMLWQSWLYYIRINFKRKLKWLILEIYLPPEVEKTPLAMEQFFALLHSALFKGGWWKRYVEGRVQEWFNVEIVSLGGKLHFYIRLAGSFRNLVESAIYGQYPQAEIYEVEDHTRAVPDEIPSETHNLFGAEFILGNADAYPIRTYSDFEFETKEGRANIDPLAGLTEAMSKLKEGEQFWMQIGILPLDDSWKEEGQKIILKLIGRTAKEEKGSYVLARFKKELEDLASGAAQAPFKTPEYSEFQFGSPKSDKPHSLMQFLSPGEQDVVKAIERKIAKVGFETTIRVIYLAQKEVFNIPNFFSVVGGFRQFSIQNLNFIKWNSATLTVGQQPFKKRKEIFKKKWLLYKHRLRLGGEKKSIFNIEELATIFHFPGRIVASPTMPRISAKKGEPPAGLPTY